MTLALFYDTETTGLPLYLQPSSHADQPHIVQLAACLVDLDTRKTISSMDVIIYPLDWEIPAEVTAIHGISTDYARAVGVSERAALGLFELLFDNADTRIAHNESFDARIVRIAQHRYQPEIPENSLEAWKAAPAICTMKLAAPICKVPPTEKMLASGKSFKYKSPSLSEAYQYFTGKPLENAHSAMADVQACMVVYFAIKDWMNTRAPVEAGLEQN